MRVYFPDFGSVTGVLSYTPDGGSSQAAANARVTLMDGRGQGRVTRADAEGNFRFTALQAGQSYRLGALLESDGVRYTLSADASNTLTAPSGSRLDLGTKALVEQALQQTINGAPIVQINPPVLTGSVVTVTGRLGNFNGSAELIVNREPVETLTLTQNGTLWDFSTTVTLIEPQNGITVRATNLNGQSNLAPPRLITLNTIEYGSVGLTIESPAGIGTEGRLQVMNAENRIVIDRPTILTGTTTTITLNNLPFGSYSYQLFMPGFVGQLNNFVVDEASESASVTLSSTGIDLSWISFNSVVAEPQSEGSTLAKMSGNLVLTVPQSRVESLGNQLPLAMQLMHGSREGVLSQPVGLPAELPDADTITTVADQTIYTFSWTAYREMEPGVNRFSLRVSTQRGEFNYPNRPFELALVEDLNQTNTPPVADAGSDQTVSAGVAVTLEGSASSDTESPALAYHWMQLDGPPTRLTNPTSATPTFMAPSLLNGAELTFELTVFDAQGGRVVIGW